MTCVNCDKPALWIYDVSGTAPVQYCEGCVPNFVRPLIKAGLVKTTAAYNALKTATLEQLAPEVEVTPEVVPETTPVEVDPEVTDEPAAKKRAAKAAAETTEI